MQAWKGTRLPVAVWRCGLLPHRLGLSLSCSVKPQHRLLMETSSPAALEGSLLCCSQSPVGLQVASTLLSGRRSHSHAAACYTQEAATFDTETLCNEADSAGCPTGERNGRLSSEVSQPSQFCVVNFYHLTSVQQPFKASIPEVVSIHWEATPGTLAQPA